MESSLDIQPVTAECFKSPIQSANLPGFLSKACANDGTDTGTKMKVSCLNTFVRFAVKGIVLRIQES